MFQHILNMFSQICIFRHSRGIFPLITCLCNHIAAIISIDSATILVVPLLIAIVNRLKMEMHE